MARSTARPSRSELKTLRAGGTLAGALVAAVFLAFVGCGVGETSPVARLAATEVELELPWPEWRDLELKIEPLTPLPEGDAPVVFVHLLDADGQILRTFDHALAGDWRPGAGEIVDRFPVFQSALAEPLPAGNYELVGGIYGAVGEKYEVETRLVERRKRQYRIATVRVPDRRSIAPKLLGRWTPPDLSSDLQLIGPVDAFASEPAGVQVPALDRGTWLLMVLALPRDDFPRERISLLGADRIPTATVVDSCSGSRQEISGYGPRILRIRLAAAAGGSSCELTIASNFAVRPTDGSAARGVRLGALSVSPAPGSGD